MSPLVLMKMGDRGRAELVGSMARVITWSPTMVRGRAELVGSMPSVIIWSPTMVRGRMSVKATLLAGITSVFSVLVLVSTGLADGIPESRGMKDISTGMRREVIMMQCHFKMIIKSWSLGMRF